MEFIKDPVKFLLPETTPSGVRTTCSSSPGWLGTPWAAPLGTYSTLVDSFSCIHVSTLFSLVGVWKALLPIPLQQP
jgi:hypothetical protein